MNFKLDTKSTQLAGHDKAEIPADRMDDWQWWIAVLMAIIFIPRFSNFPVLSLSIFQR